MDRNKTDLGPIRNGRAAIANRAAAAAALGLLLGADAVPGGPHDRKEHLVMVENASSAAISCRATIAHWFAADLGDAVPGGTVAFTVEIDADGTVLLANARGERMPVETAYCGYEGRAWTTRSQLDLRAPARGVAAGTAVRAVCAGNGGDNLACR